MAKVKKYPPKVNNTIKTKKLTIKTVPFSLKSEMNWKFIEH